MELEDLREVAQQLYCCTYCQEGSSHWYGNLNEGLHCESCNRAMVRERDWNTKAEKAADAAWDWA